MLKRVVSHTSHISRTPRTARFHATFSGGKRKRNTVGTDHPEREQKIPDPLIPIQVFCLAIKLKDSPAPPGAAVLPRPGAGGCSPRSRLLGRARPKAGRVRQRQRQQQRGSRLVKDSAAAEVPSRPFQPDALAAALRCRCVGPRRGGGGQLTRFLHPWNSPGKNTEVGCHFLLQKDRMGENI